MFDDHKWGGDHSKYRSAMMGATAYVTVGNIYHKFCSQFVQTCANPLPTHWPVCVPAHIIHEPGEVIVV